MAKGRLRPRVPSASCASGRRARCFQHNCHTQGKLISSALDSGIARCLWHRIRLDADIPPGTSLSVAVATLEDPAPPNQGDASRDKGWGTFPTGLPHFSDWRAAPGGSVDFLID